MLAALLNGPRLRARRVIALSVLLAASFVAALSAPAFAATGPYPTRYLEPSDLKNHTVYRPVNLPPGKLPVLVWGESGCIANGIIFSDFLSEIASHGIIVIASGGPAQIGATTVAYEDQSVDWAKAQDAKVGGPLYGKLDATHIAASGHSCGGLEAYQLTAKRPEVKTLAIMNSGQINQDPAQLAKILAPTLYVLGGSGDVAYQNGIRDYKRLNPAIPAFLASDNNGHFGTFYNQNGGADAQILWRWIKWQLTGDAAAGQFFTGATCVLCTNPHWAIQRRNIS